jgi:hypothetical protein
MLEISITVKIHGLIAGDIIFNERRCTEGVNIFSAGIHENLHLYCKIQQFDEGTSAIEITDYTINGYNVIPTYQHKSSSGNAYHDKIGRWDMYIPSSFYAWYHTASGQGWIA